MVERALLRLARAIDSGSRRIAAACLLAAMASAAAVSRMPVKSDILDVLPEGNPAISAFRDFVRDFGMMDGLVVVVESNEPSADLLIGMADSIGERLSASPLIASVDYNLLKSGAGLVARHFPAYLDRPGAARLAERLSPDGIRRQVRRNREALLSPLSMPFEAEMIARDPLNLREIVRDSLLRRAAPKGLDLSTGYYIDASHSFALVMARPRGAARDLAFVPALKREVERIVAQAEEENGNSPSVKVGVTGGYALAAEAASAIRRDMILSFAVSLLLVIGLVHAAFRPGLAVLGAFVLSLFAALAWTLLLAYLLYGSLNIVTAVVAAMLIGLYVDYMIHTYKRFEESFRESGDVRKALEVTYAGTGKAILTGAVTTAVSFFSVVVTSFRGLHELGVVAGFGILFCMLATFLLMGSLLACLAREKPALLAAGRPSGFGGEWAARLAGRHGKAVVAASAVLAVLAVLSAARVRFDTDLDSLGLRESPAQAVRERIEAKLGERGEPLFLVARAEDDRRLAEDFDALERRGEAWRRSGAVGRFSSPGLLLPPPAFQKAALEALSGAGAAGARPPSGASLAGTIRAEMTRQGMTPDPSLEGYADIVARAMSSGEIVGLRELARSGDPRAPYFHNPERKAIAAHLSSPARRFGSGALAALSDDVKKLGPDFTLTGPGIIFEEIRRTIYWESGLAILLSFGANLLILRLHFGRWRRVLLVMLPVTGGTVLAVGAMGLLGIRFNFFNVAGIALMFGFGVDYGIYLVQAHVEGGGCGGAEALRRTGGSVVLCAVTTVASCGSLVTTQYRGLASVGSVLSLGAVFCLLASLLLLPALLGDGRNGEARP